MDRSAPAVPRRALLAPADPAAVELVNPGGSAPVLIVCDHASRAVPAALDRLGLGEDQLSQHIGWDIGAAAVTRSLAARLDAPAVLSGFSRLVVDCNRALHDETLIPEVSDGIVIPGNAGLSEAERDARLNECFWPYHQAITGLLDRFAAPEVAPAMLSIHSFTPRMEGFDRPWQIGILWDKDPRIPLPLIQHLATHEHVLVGDNEPYSARDPHGFTMLHHAEARGLPHALIELRQDEIATEAGAERYAALLEAALRPILAAPHLYRPAFYA